MTGGGRLVSELGVEWCRGGAPQVARTRRARQSHNSLEKTNGARRVQVIQANLTVPCRRDGKKREGPTGVSRSRPVCHGCSQLAARLRLSERRVNCGGDCDMNWQDDTVDLTWALEACSVNPRRQLFGEASSPDGSRTANRWLLGQSSFKPSAGPQFDYCDHLACRGRRLAPQGCSNLATG